MPTRSSVIRSLPLVALGVLICSSVAPLVADERAAEDQTKPAAKTNDQGDRLEVLGFDPPLPAELRLGQRLTVRVAYELKSGEPALIFVRPMTKGKRSPGYAAHGSRRYEKGKGEIEGWFTFRQPTVVDQVQVTLITDRTAKSPTLELLAEADAKWTGKAVAADDPKRPDNEPPTEYEKLQQRLAGMGQLEPVQRRKLLDETIAYVKASELGLREFSLAINACRSLERVDQEMAATAYEDFAELFTASKEARIAPYIDKMKGAARRNRLPGNPIEVFGKTVDGDDFQWKDYQGKVVLVDFWATWCGPCIAELPNVKKQYEQYHEKGFEVVAVSLDKDKSRLVDFIDKREIPWTNLFSDDAEKTGWDHPLATHYGILAIPSTILVDQKGNVVSLSARGSELPKLLAELLGEPRE